jgi:hypothetical protein
VTRMIRMSAVALMFAMTAALGAQEKQAPAPAAPAVARTQVPLKIQVLLTRYQGEKKLSSVPYILWVTSNDGVKTSLRMGVQVPIFAGDGSSFNYRDVGTNIDCSATTAADGVHKVNLTVTDSSVYLTDRDKSSTGSGPTSAPTFRSFTSNFSILLRDGQTGLYTSATDQVSGEVLKLEATLNVLR